MLSPTSLTVRLLLLAISISTAAATWPYNRCPPQCDCVMRWSPENASPLRTVDCANRRLDRFPELGTIPADTQVLALQDNSIPGFPVASRLWLPGLLSLNVSGNALETLPDSDRGFFEGAYNLKYLDLSHNRLQVLGSEAFSGLFNLRSLTLTNNELAVIYDDAFRGLLQLHSLHVDHNRLAYVKHAWWTNLQQLQHINLASNAINVLQESAFKLAPKLKGLNVASNSIASIDSRTFDGLFELDTLNLANNRLEYVPQMQLIPLRDSLRSLILDNNPIARTNTDDLADFRELAYISMSHLPKLRLVERGTFKKLPKLAAIQMHDCGELVWIDAQAIVSAPVLSRLLLHNNALSTLDELVAHSLPQLAELSLYGNPIACECDTNWLRRMAGSAKNTIHFLDIDRLVCASPPALRLSTFLSVTPETSSCRPRLVDILTDEIVDVETGDSIVLDCRAAGQPQPSISWLAPDGSTIRAQQYHRTRLLRNGDTLHLNHMQPDDSGIYTCMASSRLGTEMRQYEVRVAPIRVQLLPVKTGPNSVTVVWQGTDRALYSFRLVYRNLSPDEGTHSRVFAGTLAPMMLSFTIESLLPDTPYELCLTPSDSQQLVNINCVTVRTDSRLTLAHSWQQADLVQTATYVAILVALIITLLCLTALIVLLRMRAAQRQSLRTQQLYQFLADAEASNSTEVIYRNPGLQPDVPAKGDPLRALNRATLFRSLQPRAENIYAPLHKSTSKSSSTSHDELSS